ncbi:U3 small nucleolar RNA-associated protein 25 homolog [Pieris rapae]|uniref:U3 small nucleolar RNA-associated protein 25 homolog n=1 Tax=Pieris rapae TaxID=64459 RepID=UPI001E27F5F2|nr:U3 small nucleolar RNA-associated protein 25 homolog [Pieris rapae]
MGNHKKFLSRKRKGNFKFESNRKRKDKKDDEVINKKAKFNRYKDKQKVEEILAKKKQIEDRFKQQDKSFSESEPEDDTYTQLMSSFKNNNANKLIESEEESLSEGDFNVKKSAIHDPSNDSALYSESEENNEISNYELENEENGLEKDRDLANDPFTKHLQYELSDELLVAMSNSQPFEKKITKEWPSLGHLHISIPQPMESVAKISKPKISILEEKTYASLGSVPQSFKKVDFNELYIKSQIKDNIVSSNKNNLIKRDLELSEVFTPLQKELFSIMNNYQDLYYSDRTFTNCDEIRYAYCLHVANHMLKTRTKILHHNAKLSKKADISDEYRDQGLVRPKVIILVPFKDAAYRVVKALIDIVVPKEAGQVVNKNRFEDDFTGGELLMPTKNPKPEDYELLFSGNTDDTFRLGLTLTKKTLKLYTDFYASDILIASPLGLRMIVGAEGEEDRDYDFLASIELLILDQADVFLMQNWDHLLHVLDHFHLQPKKTHGTDFSRVRSWAVNGWSKYYRQTLVFSSIALPEIRSIVNKKCQNYHGKVIISNEPEIGAIRQVIVQVPQLFHRFNATSPLSAVDARFEYFIKEILPKQRDPLMSHTLIYVPSYFDFVRLRNYFKKEDISFVQVCEYTKDAKIARARDMFFHTEAHFLLYSERVHFFRRLRIKGIRHIIFYQPPTYPHFYSEMLNLMQESNQNKYGGSECNMTSTTLYCRYDAARGAAVLGVDRITRMLNSDKPLHMYLTGDK